MSFESFREPEPPKRVRRTANERRKDVLAAAIREFATYGLHGGSTERIAASVGISQPYVLRLFGTKKALFLAALDQVCRQILREWATGFSEVLFTTHEPPVEDMLQEAGNRYMTLLDSVDELRLVLQAYAAAEDEDVRKAVHGWLAEMFDYVEKQSGASPEQTRGFFAKGMMLTVAASIQATDVAADQRWARAYTMQPIDP